MLLSLCDYQEIAPNMTNAVCMDFVENQLVECVINCNSTQLTEGIRSYRDGKLLHDAFNFLSAEEREFIKSGILPEKWRNL